MTSADDPDIFSNIHISENIHVGYSSGGRSSAMDFAEEITAILQADL